MKPVADVFTAAAIRRLAGPGPYERGVGYLSDHRVEAPVVLDGRARALVRGTMPYVVELWTVDGRPRWDCSCPAAEDGSFCKHCVAVALALRRGIDAPELPSRASADAVPAARQQTAGRTTARKGVGGGQIKLSVWMRRIERAFAPYGDFVSYYEAEGWADGIHVMIENLEGLCDLGHPDAVAGLAEHAFGWADESINYVDDSDGHLGGVIERLSELHLRACREGTVDPAELAGQLVKLELKSELDGFHRAAAHYADVLGEAGLAEYRRLLEPRWQQVQPTTEWDGENFAVRQAMIGWALATGDPDALIEVHSRGALMPSDILEIVTPLHTAGRIGEAFSWSQRGIDDSRSRPRAADDLREFLARLLAERGHAKSATKLFWEAFIADPTLVRFRRLQENDPSQDWLARCRGELRDILERSHGSGPRIPHVERSESSMPAPHAVPQAATALVEILLYEGLIDEAWDAAAEFGCTTPMKLTLARFREQTHPLDAISVYEPQALTIIGLKRPDRYRSAVDLMERIRRLADSAGEPERFTSLLQLVRTKHKPKRRLMAELDERDWP
ncbi:SWIM zinc finger family protein [Candidatus Poriferisodalis sp.]|uniref:SWIM zinc finger family protein n=1 Tax=Candidatus Poriferisodalis sp. TaxID=3101277 RepID=UPI003B02E8D8